MIKEDHFGRDAMDLLDKHFPIKEGKRGAVMVLVGDLVLRHKEIIDALYVRRTNTTKDERGNGRKPVLPLLSTGDGTIRSRMPSRSNDSPTYRIGKKIIPKSDGV